MLNQRVIGYCSGSNFTSQSATRFPNVSCFCAFHDTACTRPAPYVHVSPNHGHIAMRKLSPLERAVNNPIVFLTIVLLMTMATAMAVTWADETWAIGSLALF